MRRIPVCSIVRSVLAPPGVPPFSPAHRSSRPRLWLYRLAAQEEWPCWHCRLCRRPPYSDFAKDSSTRVSIRGTRVPVGDAEMGTVLSISPTSRKGGTGDDRIDGAQPANGKEKSLKRPSVLISALTWKRLVAASAKKKSAKKVNPNPPGSSVEQLNHENAKKSQQSTWERKGSQKPGLLAVPVPTVPKQNPQAGQGQNVPQNPKQPRSVQKQAADGPLVSPRRVIVQASTGELLRCLSQFLCRRCFRLKELSPNEIILWFRNVDRSLLIQGWQDEGFINPVNVVFVYLLCRDAIGDDIDSEFELQATFLTCLYLAYSYMGSEISYPLKPFLVEANKEAFWERSLRMIDKMSARMLQVNSDPHFFTEVFQDLKNEAESRDANGRCTNNVDR